MSVAVFLWVGVMLGEWGMGVGKLKEPGRESVGFNLSVFIASSALA